MDYFNADALKRAMGKSPSINLDDANDLVRRTLAQHGLSADLPAGLDLPAGIGFPAAGGGAPTPGRERFTCEAGTREYIVHAPDNSDSAPQGLVLMLHGCTQTPEDFTAGTRMNAHADTHGLIAVYPAQSRGANAQTCWNWFSKGDQRRDRGEPAILAGMVREVAETHGVPADRVFVAGLSAGAAMAVILGRSYPDLFAGVAAHSGLPYGSATDVPNAFAAMRGESQQRTTPTGGPAVPTIVFHGSTDATVVPANGDRIIEDALAASKGSQLQTVTEAEAGGRRYRQVTTLGPDGAPLAEHWSVEGLGHAWSGGDRAGSYADPAGPDASAEIVRFFLSLSR